MHFDPNCSISTGVCEAPILAIRQLTCELIKALPSLEGFDLLKYEDINQVLADVVRKGTLRGRVGKVVGEMVQAAGEGFSLSNRSEGVAASSVGTASGYSAASTAVVSAVCAASKARAEEYDSDNDEEEPLYKLQLILFRDSGGQPQFHEVVAAFSHNVSLVLVFIKLNERLDALCTNAFTDEEGKWFTEQCPSLLTNEQMVVQFVHTMMCKPVAGSEGMHTRFMVVGTHRDLMHECEETLTEKNERLASLLLPALEENLIMNGDDIIFAVNAKNPDENDEKCFDLIREKVADLSRALDVDTPIVFLVLLNDVNKYAEEQRKKVVSVEECQAIAGRLKMERQNMEAALIFFNDMSVWMRLQTVAEKDMEQYVPAPSEHVAPLFLHFHMSRIAKGVFCSTHTCMRSKYGWTTCYTVKREKVVPACLFRNAVRLYTASEKISEAHIPP